MTRKFFAALLLSAAPLVAQASLLGQSADCDMSPTGWSCSPGSAEVIDPGVEFELFLLGGDPFFSVDLSGSGLLLTSLSGINLSGTGEVLTISGLSGLLGASLAFSEAPGFDGSDVSFGPTQLALVLGGSDWQAGQQARLEISQQATPVAEPAPLVLLGLTLLILAGARRRS